MPVRPARIPRKSPECGRGVLQITAGWMKRSSTIGMPSGSCRPRPSVSRRAAPEAPGASRTAPRCNSPCQKRLFFARLGFRRGITACLIQRTAGYGPVRPVVWEGFRLFWQVSGELGLGIFRGLMIEVPDQGNVEANMQEARRSLQRFAREIEKALQSPLRLGRVRRGHHPRCSHGGS